MENFWNKIEKTEACWLWTGTKTKTGYGRLVRRGRWYMAHRYAYTNLVGDIPDGLELDHLCRIRNCVRPEHLEAVTHTVNVQRGSGGRPTALKCPQGHEYAGTNLYIRPNGFQDCRACRAASARRRRRLAL